MNEKIRWLRNKIKSIDLEAMIVSNPINIKYLTGIDAEGILILARKENFFITDGRYIEAVKSLLTITLPFTMQVMKLMVLPVKDLSIGEILMIVMFITIPVGN